MAVSILIQVYTGRACVVTTITRYGYELYLSLIETGLLPLAITLDKFQHAFLQYSYFQPFVVRFAIAFY